MLIKYVYDYSGKNRRPVACVVGYKDNDEVRIGISVCNPKDNFVKRIARDIAYGRALANSTPELPNGKIDTIVYRNYPDGKVSYREINYPKFMAIQDAADYIKERLNENCR